MKADLIAPAYPYQQFSDDADIKALFEAYNIMMHDIIAWMASHPMALYTNPAMTGPLLSYCALCLYGQFRYRISYVEIRHIDGPLNTSQVNALPVDDTVIDKHYRGSAINDDVFKRILTWNLYKGDGLTFSIPWLKRRVMRFLTGENGQSWRFNSTHAVSITVQRPYVMIRLPRDAWPPDLVGLLGRMLTNGILNVPPMLTFSITTDRPS